MSNRELRSIWLDIRAAAENREPTNIDARLPDLLRERYEHREVHLSESRKEAGLTLLLRGAREGIAPDTRTNGHAPRKLLDEIDAGDAPTSIPFFRKREVWIGLVAAAACVVILILGLLRSPQTRPPVVRETPHPSVSPKPETPTMPKRSSPPHEPSVTVEKQPTPRRGPARTAKKTEPPLDVIGAVDSAMGQPFVRQPGGAVASIAKSGTKIGYGSRIETGDIDKAVLRFNDGTRIALDFNTVVVINSTERGVGRPRELRLLSGSLVASVVHSERAGPFRIQTSPATAEVMGTMFRLALEDSRARLQVREGSVEFFNEFGKVVATSQTESFAIEGKAPSEPQRIHSFLFRAPGSDVTLTIENPAPSAKEGRTMMAWTGDRLDALSDAALTGDIVAARKRMESRMEARPDAATSNNLGVLDEMEDNLAQAVRRYETAVRLDPAKPLYRSNLGRALRRVGNPKRALKELQLAAELDRKGWQRLDDYAEALNGEGQPEHALKVIGEALRREPTAVEAWLTKSQILADLGKSSEAIEACRQMVALEPNKPHAWESLAQALGPTPEAEACLMRALQLDLNDSASLNTYATLLVRTGRVAEAEKPLRRLTEVAPKMTVGWDNLTTVLTRLGRPAEAVEAAKKAISLDHRNTFAYLNMTTALATLGRFEEAEAAARKAVEFSPDLPNTHTILGSTLSSRNKDAEAIAELKIAIDIDPAYLGAHQTLGNVYELDKQFDKAEAEYRKVSELSPKIWWGWGNLSRLLIHLKRYEDAEKVLRRFMDIAPGFVPPHSRLAQALAAQGKLDDAIGELRKVIELAGEDRAAKLGAYLQLGALYEAKEDKAAAIDAYRQALQIDSANKSAREAIARLGG